MSRVPLLVLLALAGGFAVAAAADPCATTTGVVTGIVQTGGGTPLPGARVRVQTCLGDPILTDVAGRFTIAVPAGPQVIAAALDGYYIGCPSAQPGGACERVAAGADVVIALDPLPGPDDPSYVFRDPVACQSCHAEIYAQWSQSSKATTNRNRWVDALYNGNDLSMPAGPPPDPDNPPYFSFLTRNKQSAHPERTGECANCHQPAYVGLAPTHTNFNDHQDPAKHGIGCDFCHRIVDVDVSPTGIRRPNLVPGNPAVYGALPVKTTMLRTPGDPGLVLGPFDDTTFVNAGMRAGHATILRSSRLCAACHEDNGDTRNQDDDFNETYDGPASQLTYTEWLQSPYAAQGIECQDCHMPPTGSTRLCDLVDIPRDPSQVRSHRFEGTTPEFLHRALTLRTASRVEGTTLTVDVDLTNTGAGHHVPTGVTIRNVLLVVSPRDKAGNVLAQTSGPTVPNWGGTGGAAVGGFAGLPGRGFARVLVDEFGAENVLFTEAVDAFDNRIAAGATDHSTYTFELPADWRKRDVRVDTRVYFRRVFKPFADQRKLNVPFGDNPHGTRGDGSDYDENGSIMAEVTDTLVCKRSLGGVTATFADGTLEITGTIRLAGKQTFTPAASGVQVALGDREQSGSLVQQLITGFTGTGPIQYEATEGAVRQLSFARLGKRAYRMSLAVAGIDPASLPRPLVVAVDSAGLCYRATLRCKPRGDTIRCR